MSAEAPGAMPAVFLSHGSPTVLTDDDAAHAFLGALGGELPRPRAILMVSAHWESDAPAVSLADAPDTIHDFGGFPPELYEMTYRAPGAPDVAERAASLLERAGHSVRRHPSRGLDHGAWVPLKLMYPAADIPVTQLSIQHGHGPQHHLDVGRALAPLKDDGVLIVGSGSATHNLEAVFRARLDPGAAVPDWVRAFADWLADTLAAGRVDDLLAYRTLAPSARENHPTEDHILPLFVALGAALGPEKEPAQSESLQAERLHASYSFGALAMDAYAFT